MDGKLPVAQSAGIGLTMTSTATTYVAVVDDDQSVRRSFARLLRAAGIQPVTYGSAEAFLADLKRPKFDCVVLDVQLGGMSGIELGEVLAATRTIMRRSSTSPRTTIPKRVPGQKQPAARLLPQERFRCRRARRHPPVDRVRAGYRGAAISGRSVASSDSGSTADCGGSRIGVHPPHEDLVAQRQERRADEHAEDAVGRHASQRAEQDHRHRRIDPATEQQRLQHVVEHAADEQQHRVRDGRPGAVGSGRPDVADRRQR
jgi:hypothetical protein